MICSNPILQRKCRITRPSLMACQRNIAPWNRSRIKLIRPERHYHASRMKSTVNGRKFVDTASELRHSTAIKPNAVVQQRCAFVEQFPSGRGK